MKQKRGSTSPQEGRRRIFAQAFGTAISTEALARVRAALSGGTYDEFFAWLAVRPEVRRGAFPALATQDPRHLHQLDSPPAASFARELAWAAAALRPHAPALNTAVAAQGRFIGHVLRGAYGDALETLDALEAATGVSVWSVSSRVAALQLSRGLDAQKAYVRSIRAGAPPRNVGAYLFHHVSVRNESTVSSRRFRVSRSAALDAFPPDGRRLAQLLRYYLLGEVPWEPDGLAELLVQGTTGAPIDYYHLLLEVCQVATTLAPVDARAAAAALARLSSVADARLGPLLFALRATAEPGSAPEVPDVQPLPPSGHAVGTPARTDQIGEACRVYDRLLGGDALAPAEALAKYRDAPDAPEWIEPVVAAWERTAPLRADGEAVGLADQVAGGLYALWARETDAQNARDWVAKLALNFPSTPWTAAVSASLMASVQHPPAPEPTPEMRATASVLPLETPWFVRYVPSAARPVYRRALADGPCGTPHLAAVAAVEDGRAADGAPAGAARTAGPGPALPDTLREDYRDVLWAEAAWHGGDFGAAVARARPALRSDDALVRSRALQLTTWAHLRSRAFAACVGAVVDAALENREALHVCPLRELADAIPEAERTHLGADPRVGVLYDLAARRFGTAYDVARKEAFEDLLESYSVRRPSALPPDFGGGAAAVYFLRHLCAPSVLETSLGGYEDEDDLAAERMAVCRRLMRLDPKHAVAYEAEIKETVQELTIGKRVRELDTNRVYVDTPGVRAEALQRVRESFRRLLDFLRHDIPILPLDAQAEVAEAVMQAVDSGDAGKLDSLVLPENEPADLLASIVRDVADVYFLSPAHGLERYLSTRLRHGVIEGRLRTPLAEAALVTARLKASNTYQPDEVWGAALGLRDTPAARAISDRLAAFARAYDDLTLRISSDWVRACPAAPDRPELFQYEVKPSFLGLMAGLVTPELSADAFVGLVVGAMQNTLEQVHLPAARAAIGTAAKQEATDLLLALETDVCNVCRAAGVPSVAFEGAVARARTQMQLAFDYVASWFASAASGESDPFTVDLAVEVTIRSVQAIFPGFEARTEASGSGGVWQGSAAALLHRVVDVVFPALQNAAEHGRGAPTAAAADIALRHDGQTTHVRIANDLAPEVDVPTLRRRLDRLAAEQADGRYLSAVSDEGGSGLHKLRSHLDALSEAPALTFGLEGHRFVVEFDLQRPGAG